MLKYLIIFFALASAKASDGYFIKSKPEGLQYSSDDWSIFQQKLGLSREKVALLKSQKNQQNTLNLLHRFIEDNPKYVKLNANTENYQKIADPFWNVFNSLVKYLRLPKQTLKTSLNFELNDNGKNPEQNLKRSRRKIAVKMVDDIPTEKLDELLKLFNRQNGIENSDLVAKHGSSAENEEEDNDDYIDAEKSEEHTSSLDPDYMYESLYEDDQGATSSSKTHGNTEFTALQDLILQAKRQNQW